ncbi:hypothetical protein C8R45DRAFT_385156 [Mycena sanguinolenta]|nr:hypothetical protein C8R45DRAFT_385156 [Mycena sanguinolenta]
MHPALSIREIVEMACDHLLLRAHDARSLAEAPRGRKALCALASTCKLLQAPALDTLWRNQDSIVPWLSCFPDDLFNVRPVLASEKNPLCLLRPVVPADWERSNSNAARVEKLSFEFQTRFAPVFAALNVFFPSGSIFPRLRSLSWSSTSAEDFPYIRIFLTPRLSSISITYEPSILNWSLLYTLASTCPHLTNVELYFIDDVHSFDPLAIASTSRFLQSLHRVESLITPCVDATALEHIGKLQGLAYLCVNFVPDGLEAPNYGPRSFFHNLHDLILQVADPPKATHIIRMGSQIPLKFLSIGWEDFYSADEIEGLYNAVAESCSDVSLTTLTFKCSGGDQDRISGPNAPRYAINSHLLRILFSFGNIIHLSITSPVEFDISDSTLADAARAWPLLDTIELKVFYATDPPTSRLTVQSLHSFAEYCPRLRSVWIAFDATAVTTVTSFQLPASPHGLTDLCVAHSAISKPGPVARILSGIFPDLRTITLPKFYGTIPVEIQRRGKLWKEVEELLPEFAAAREERARMSA